MLLTKSKFLIGIECPRCFWKAMHEEQEEELTAQQEKNIEQGIFVGNLAKKLFEDAIDLSHFNFEDNIEATKRGMASNKIIFEAGFKVENLFARMDILIPSVDGSWNIVEVKSTTGVKVVHTYDVAFQKYVCEREGIRINQCYVLHLNNSYVRLGEINLEELFVQADITDEVKAVYDVIPQYIEDLFDIYNLKEAPQITPKKYLFKEYPCEFGTECWSFLPDNNVTQLYKMNRSKIADLIRRDILKISDAPSDFLSERQLIQKEAVISSKEYINRTGIKNFISKLQYPLYYFDFETFTEAIPRFDGCKVYAQIPFQYSIHVQQEDGALKHYEFLHMSPSDPRKDILEEMLKVLGVKGTIIVFNQSFEKTRLRELAQLYPEYGACINSILERIVDLMVPFSSFDYYSPIQQGSCSIKKVLPAVTDKSYSDMNIGNGGDAATLYFSATFENKFSDGKKDEIYRDLLDYCKLDTEGMVWIVDGLKKMI